MAIPMPSSAKPISISTRSKWPAGCGRGPEGFAEGYRIHRSEDPRDARVARASLLTRKARADQTPWGTVLVGVVRNMTPLVESERELARERDFISAVLDSAEALILVVDRRGRIQRWNAAWRMVRENITASRPSAVASADKNPYLDAAPELRIVDPLRRRNFHPSRESLDRQGRTPLSYFRPIPHCETMPVRSSTSFTSARTSPS